MEKVQGEGPAHGLPGPVQKALGAKVGLLQGAHLHDPKVRGDREVPGLPLVKKKKIKKKAKSQKKGGEGPLRDSEEVFVLPYQKLAAPQDKLRPEGARAVLLLGRIAPGREEAALLPGGEGGIVLRANLPEGGDEEILALRA